MRRSFDSNFSTNIHYYSVYDILKMVDNGRIDIEIDHIDTVRAQITKHSRDIERILLGLPSSTTFWIERELFGSFKILYGAEFISAVKLFIDGRFALRGMKYLPHLNNMIFDYLSFQERDRLYNSEMLFQQINGDIHPQLKCEFYRSLYKNSRDKNISQVAREFAFTRAHKFLDNMQNDLDFRVDFINHYQDKRDKKRNEAKKHQFLLMVILFIYLKENDYHLDFFGDSHHTSLIKTVDYFYIDEVISSKISSHDYIETALDKIMMHIDMSEIDLRFYEKNALAIIDNILSLHKINTINLNASPSSEASYPFLTDTVSIESFISLIFIALFNKKNPNIFFKGSFGNKNYKILELFND